MLPKYSVAYINSDRLERELCQFALDTFETKAWTFMNTRAFLQAVNATDFDCVLIANVGDGDLLQFESELQEGGHHMPVVRVSEESDLPALVDALRRGQYVWSIAGRSD